MHGAGTQAGLRGPPGAMLWLPGHPPFRGPGKSYFCNGARPTPPAAPGSPRPCEDAGHAEQGHRPMAAGYLRFGEQSPKPPEGASSDGAAADPLKLVLSLHLAQNKGEAGPGGVVAPGCPLAWARCP